jgi:hypothetical protein
MKASPNDAPGFLTILPYLSLDALESSLAPPNIAAKLDTELRPWSVFSFLVPLGLLTES